MNAPGHTALKRWKVFFLLLEAIVLVPFLFSLFFEHLRTPTLVSQSRMWQVILAALYLGSWLFLLIASPFFLRSLRGIALSGWIIAFGTLVYAAVPRL